MKLKQLAALNADFSKVPTRFAGKRSPHGESWLGAISAGAGTVNLERSAGDRRTRRNPSGSGTFRYYEERRRIRLRAPETTPAVAAARPPGPPTRLSPSEAASRTSIGPVSPFRPSPRPR